MSKYKYQEVFEQIKDEILTGVKKPGEKLPDVNKLEDFFTTSTITINRALNELQKSGYIERIKGQGSFICDPQASAAKTSLSSGQFISCIIPFDLNQNDFLQSVETTCRKKHFLFTVQNSQFSSQIERESILNAREKGAAGIIIYPVSNTDNIDLYSKMIIDHYPFVIIDRKLNALEHPFVSCTNRESFYKITQYLLDKGHRRIGFLCGEMSLNSVYERFQGYCQALINEGITIDNNLIIDHFFVQRDKPDESLIKNIINRYISSPLNATAIACTNDFIASMVIQQGNFMGIRIPEDLSITGFDNLYFSSLLHPPLTTVTQPFLEIGAKATTLLLDMIEKKDINYETVKCQAAIVERKSVSVLPL